MRIGFDAKRLFNNFTGLGNYSRFVMKALLEHYPDHHYTLYSPKVKDHKETHEFRTNPKLLVRTPPRWVKGSGFGSFWRSVNLGNIAFRDGMDVFHGLSNELPVSKPKGLKTVVTVHDLIFIRYPKLYKKIDVNIYKKKIISACKSADKIIAISHQTSSDLQHYLKVPKERITVIYQGCHSVFNTKAADEEISKVKAKYNLPDQFVLTVGTLEPRKNALLLLKAAAQTKERIPVVLIGKSTAYQKQLNKLIEEENLSDRVHFIHHADFLDLPKIYQAAKIFVYPSRFEGFGIPIVEAIASGVPVIAARGSCLEEAGGPSSVYVDPDNDKELASAIDRLLNDDSACRKMVEASKEYIQQFEPKRIADKLMEVYKEVLA
ncbi:MAG: glycosyltransferase family 4 protein [Cyclobacteriaceae bacterium]|jgi:glycosyltransferase involved in cell wall biosynthesis|nr:glycosyltransferase family 4 protein [Cyclobacteriaceae bacterium]